MFEREIRDFSTVRRWGTLRTIQTQMVSDHSFYVALYARDLVPHLRPAWREICDIGKLLTFAIWHDASETLSGDLPGPWKREVAPDNYKAFERRYLNQRFPESPHQEPDSHVEQQVVKVANSIDEIMFLSIEMSLGNRPAQRVRDDDVIPRYEKRLREYDLFEDNVAVYNATRNAMNWHANGYSEFLKG